MSNRHPSSFRDPSGFLFTENGTLFRSVSHLYQKNYDHLIQSGLYNKLVEADLLIPHKEVAGIGGHDASSCPPIPPAHVRRGNLSPYKILQPEIVPFISYPYEWCFSQLQDAALALIRIQKQALDCNMSLKDASAYNIQFFKGNPLLIDTLSFEIYKENQPWVAYRQFCQHFLAPLALMASRDIRLGQLMRIYIDGLPLDLASKLLPMSTWLKPALMTHIHLHAKAQKRFGGDYGDMTRIRQNPGSCPHNLASASSVIPAQAGIQEKSCHCEAHVRRGNLIHVTRKVSKYALTALIGNLESAITNMLWRPTATEWSNYYEDTNYTPAAMTHKKKLVEAYINESNPRTVWDLGANTGVFSRLAAEKGIQTTSFDIDTGAVEKHYSSLVIASGAKQSQNGAVAHCPPLPLCLDLTNPSPSIGWANAERLSLIERGPADTVLALALIHHLAISNNVPLNHIAAFISKICRYLIIEFVPKNDSQVQRLLRTREDIFPDYNQDHFEASFGDHFSILQHEKIADSERTLHLMRSRATSN
jgi:hypothetical protein